MAAALVVLALMGGIGLAWAAGLPPFGDDEGTAPAAGGVTVTVTTEATAPSASPESSDVSPDAATDQTEDPASSAPTPTSPATSSPQPSTPATPEVDPLERAVTRTLSGYLAAINVGDYDAAMSWVSDGIRADSSPDQWYADYATTYDDRLAIRRIRESAGVVRVWATFRSRQEPGYGPEGARDATCLVWSIDYEMSRDGGRYVISDASGHGDPPWTRCD